MEKNEKAIGVFDSGIGGLTVLKEIVRLMPGEDTVYLGDTARVPYGTKSRETVLRYAREDARFLSGFDIKIMVVACNTASAYAASELDRRMDIPVVGVIEPGARAAAKAAGGRPIGVIGTEGTIRSGAYREAIKAIDPGAEVIERACPLFVPLAEEGITEGPLAELAARRYLEDLSGVGTLVLGCTHYPLLKKTISKVMGPRVTLIDSALSTALEVKKILSEMGLEARKDNGARRRFFVTDSPGRFRKVGGLFFGSELDGVETARME